MSMSLTLNQNTWLYNLLIFAEVVEHIHWDDGIMHPGRVIMSQINGSYLAEYFRPLLVRVHVPFFLIASFKLVS